MQLCKERCIKMQHIFDTWTEFDHGNWWGRAMDNYNASDEILPMYDHASVQLKTRIHHLRGFLSTHAGINP